MAKASKMNRGIGLRKDHPDTSVKMLTISLGHIISKRITMETMCGTNSSSWYYGFPEDVTCSSCLEMHQGENV